MKNRVVVITGATGVLGQLAAHTFAEQGASLALISDDQKILDKLASELNLPDDRILTHTANLLDEKAVQDSVEAVSAKFGRVDALIHLVGGWTGGRTLAESDADEFMLNQHAWTTIHLLRAFSPKLAENGWGRVIGVSSPLANKPTAKMGAYAMGKAAQEILLMTLADEFAGTDITTNVIQVKAIDVKGTGNPGQSVQGKGTSPQEIVAAILYLFSDEAGKVNGARIPLFG
jgi:NAD(P)-dependent dehydrogenase (short-subunit alcohol dehydrogenase family)